VVKSRTNTALQYLINGAVFFLHCMSMKSAGSTDISYLNGKLRCVAAYDLTSPRVAVTSKLWECDEPSGRRNCIRAMSLQGKKIQKHILWCLWFLTLEKDSKSFISNGVRGYETAFL